MLFSVSVTPVGEGDELTEPVSRVVDAIDRAGLEYRVNGMNTVIEGDWSEVMPVLEEAHRGLRDSHGRVRTSITVDDHPGSEGRLEGAVRDVEEELGRSVRG